MHLRLVTRLYIHGLFDNILGLPSLLTGLHIIWLLCWFASSSNVQMKNEGTCSFEVSWEIPIGFPQARQEGCFANFNHFWGLLFPWPWYISWDCKARDHIVCFSWVCLVTNGLTNSWCYPFLNFEWRSNSHLSLLINKGVYDWVGSKVEPLSILWHWLIKCILFVCNLKPQEEVSINLLIVAWIFFGMEKFCIKYCAMIEDMDFMRVHLPTMEKRFLFQP